MLVVTGHQGQFQYLLASSPLLSETQLKMCLSYHLEEGLCLQYQEEKRISRSEVFCINYQKGLSRITTGAGDI